MLREILTVVLGLLVLATLEGAYYVVRYMRDRKAGDIGRRLQRLATNEGSEQESLLRPGRFSRIASVDGLLRRVPLAVRAERLLEQADLNLSVAQLVTLSVVGALSGLVLDLQLGSGSALGFSFIVIGCLGPFVYAMAKRARRSRRVSEQLPDALETMSRALRAGHAISSSFQFVASELPAPINVEFGKAYEEQRLGRSLEEAVVAMTGRVPHNADLKILAVSINVQRETGGNLAEILDNIAGTIRARFRFYGKLRALTAEGRLSGLVLGALPIVMLVFLALTNPGYTSVLFETFIGKLFLGYAILSWGMGLVSIFIMTKMEF